MIPVTYLLIGLNVIVSLIAFTRMSTPRGSEMFTFSPYEVASGRNYIGMLLSHFSHADGGHLLFNLLTLYSFGPAVEAYLGTFNFLLIYFISGVLANLVVFYRHRSEPQYRALGASDSISGILFAAIVVAPSINIIFVLIPFPIPAPIFAVGYIALSMFFMRRGGGNISHEAHLAGAFVGLILAGILSPDGWGPLMDSLRSFF